MQPSGGTHGPDASFASNPHAATAEIALTSATEPYYSPENPASHAGVPVEYSSLGPARELNKVVLPAYRVEPPDILVIEAIQAIPRQPYQLRVGDLVSIQVPGAFAEAPIAGTYPVGLGGLVNLGAPYGSIKVANLTIDQAEASVIERLKEYLNEDALHLVAVD